MLFVDATEVIEDKGRIALSGSEVFEMCSNSTPSHYTFFDEALHAIE